MNISIEIFPPKSPKGEIILRKNLRKFKEIAPSFVSVTCGANGSNNRMNHKVCQMVLDTKIKCVAHLTCQGYSITQTKQKIEKYIEMGISSILALRGDTPKEEEIDQSKKAFQYAQDLNRFVQDNYPEIIFYNAGYPQGHIENPNKKLDFQYQVEKLEMGVKGVITQLFFDNQHFIDYHYKLRRAGFKGQIIAGIFPITQVQQISRITDMCGISIPKKLQKCLLSYQNDPLSIKKIGTEFAIKQCLELAEHGLNDYHLYSMNQADHIIEIYQQLLQEQTIVQKYG
jgi:methylenetetrahydrofolate reductase (NADPH)